MKTKKSNHQEKNQTFPDVTSEVKPSSWGVATDNVSINQNIFPSGKGSIHVNAPSGGYTLSVSGFDHDGYPRTSRWYDDD